MSQSKFCFVISALLVIAVLSGCSSNPVSGAPQLVLMSEKKEIELGKQLHPRTMAEFGVYAAADLQAYVNEIGQNLASKSERSHLDWHFFVLDDDLVNAFALPGGYIYVTRGLLAHLNSEAELAAVLGHEIGHVTARHAVERDRDSKLLGGLATAASIATRTQAAGQATGLVGSAVISGYGRAQELQADQLGAKYIALAGYPTEATYSAVEILKRREQFEIERARIEGRKARTPHGIFATHPDNDKRFAEAVKAAEKFAVNSDTSDRAQDYMDRINGLSWGSKKTPGVFRNNYFYHTPLGIKMKFPENWRVGGQRNEIQAVSAENNAIMQVFVVNPGRKLTLEQIVERKLGVSNLKEAKKITIAGLPAYIGIGDRYVSPYGARPVRAAAILDRRRSRAYIFAGTGNRDLSRVANDSDFITTIFSFDRMKGNERDLGRPPTLKVITAEEDTTISKLAEQSAIPSFAEQHIRLLNGLYPRGEPEPGQLIKTVD